MENVDNLVTETEMQALREGIRHKYKQYQALDRDRFPDFDFNTSRANYEPLRESFEEEFFVVRKVDRAQSNIHIPSTNTLALIFCEEGYIPGKKILNTCRSYAEGYAKAVTDPGPAVPAQTTAMPAITTRLLVGSLVVMAGIVVLLVISRWFFPSAASGLIIERPAYNSTVLQQSIAEGKVSNAEMVWIVVRYKKSLRYWVQPPINVQENSWWIGAIFVGGVGKEDVGLTYQIRAFVNPTKQLKTGEVLYSWPEAELSTDIVEVVRGAEKE